MKPDKKKLKLLGQPAGPEGRPPKVSIFAAKNIRETPETIKKINETRSQNKKKRGFLVKRSWSWKMLL